MDEQKPQDQDNQNQPVSIPINEIAPPPAEESIGQKINVMSGDSDENSEALKNTEAPETAEASEANPESEEEPIHEAPAEQEQLSPVATPPEVENTENSAEQQPVITPTQPNDMSKIDEPIQASSAPAEMGVAASQMNGQKHPHRNNRKLATIVTIVTALILAGTAVFVYLSANKNTDAENNSENAQINGSSYESQQEVVRPATVEDIDRTVSEIEESMTTLDEEADFNDEGLSNDTLGL